MEPGPEAAFKVNDIVIAKVKGYPPWPAIVVTQDYLPEKIRDSKPKSYASAPILFFNDNSFMWAAETDLKTLEVEVSAKHAEKPKTKKALREAYRMASEQPTIEQYMEMVANPPPVEEPPKKRAKKASEKPPAAPRASRASTKSIKRKLKEGPLDETAVDSIELKRPKQRGRPSATRDAEVASSEDLAASSELRAELCRQARFRLQKSLLSEGGPETANLASLKAILAQIEQVDNIEIAIVRMSKLRRVLKAVVELGIEQGFKDRCLKLLDRWETQAEPVIRGLPECDVNLEELKEREGTIERETEPPSDSEAPEDKPGKESSEPEPKESNDQDSGVTEERDSGERAWDKLIEPKFETQVKEPQEPSSEAPQPITNGQ